MKVLLIVIVIGEKFYDEYKKLFFQSHINYAFKNNYDFKIIKEYLDKNIQEKSVITFNKLLVCSQEWAKDYDFIIIVDADILINPYSPLIHDYIDYGDKIGIVDEYSQPSKEGRLVIQELMKWETSATEYYKLCSLNIDTDIVLNTGLMVVQPKKHATFLEDIYNKYVHNGITHFRETHYEQSCLGYELQKNNKYILLHNKFNAIWGLTNMYNTDYITLYDYFKENYFIHFAGKTDYDIIPSLKHLVLFDDLNSQ